MPLGSKPSSHYLQRAFHQDWPASVLDVLETFLQHFWQSAGFYSCFVLGAVTVQVTPHLLCYLLYYQCDDMSYPDYCEK